MDAFEPHRALEALWRLLAEVNQHVVTHQPWKLVGLEGERERLSAVLWEGLEAVRIVAVGVQPAMPETAARVLRAIGAGPAARLGAMEWGGLPGGAELPEVQALFPRADKAALLGAAGGGQAPAAKAPPADRAPRADGTAGSASPVASSTAAPVAPSESRQQSEEKKMAAISIDDFMAVELRVARVEAAEEIPKSSKLVRLTVELAGERRTIVAGIRKQYAPEQLVGRQVVIVANLQPATLMGVESQGMVLAASLDGEAVLLQPEREVPSGTRVR
jgi:methionyl-tRNA synthetase